jgi:hypothetical protein
VFASVSFGVLVWLAVKLLGVRPGRTALSGGQVAWRTVLAGVLTPVLMVVLAAPTRVGVGASGSHDVQRTLVIVLLAMLWIVGVVLLVEAAQRTSPSRRLSSSNPGATSPDFARIYPGIYLGVHVLLWAAALPAYLAARDGVTAAGTPIGCGLYALACIVAATLIVLITRRATSEKSASAVRASAGAT